MPFIIKFPHNGKTVNNAQLLGLGWPAARGRDWDRRVLDLEDLVVRNMMVALDWLDSQQFGQKTELNTRRLMVIWL